MDAAAPPTAPLEPPAAGVDAAEDADVGWAAVAAFGLLLAQAESASAATITATCTQGLLSTYLGTSCTIGDKLFDNFTYSGNIAASLVSIDFQNVATEFRLILAPTTGAGGTLLVGKILPSAPACARGGIASFSSTSLMISA